MITVEQKKLYDRRRGQSKKIGVSIKRLHEPTMFLLDDIKSNYERLVKCNHLLSDLKSFSLLGLSDDEQVFSDFLVKLSELVAENTNLKAELKSLKVKPSETSLELGEWVD